FRQDLFYRINVIELRVPPLRERRGDVPKLADFVLRQLAAESGGAPGKLKPEALAALEAYQFPGNVRELENILERAMAMCEGDIIEADDLMLPQRVATPATAGADGFDPASVAGAAAPAARTGGAADSSLEDFISNIERDTIIKALEESRYNKTATAKKLGITFRALRYKLKKLGID
ncbi:MAG: helix-turn-helix domain-containing protein, partial [Luteibacter sp.]